MKNKINTTKDITFRYLGPQCGMMRDDLAHCLGKTENDIVSIRDIWLLKHRWTNLLHESVFRHFDEWYYSLEGRAYRHSYIQRWIKRHFLK